MGASERLNFGYSTLVARALLKSKHKSEIKGKRVLEIGTGDGSLIAAFHDMGANSYHGICLNPDNIHYLGQRLEWLRSNTKERCLKLFGNYYNLDIVPSDPLFYKREHIYKIESTPLAHSFNGPVGDMDVTIERLYHRRSENIFNAISSGTYDVIAMAGIMNQLQTLFGLRVTNERIIGRTIDTKFTQELVDVIASSLEPEGVLIADNLEVLATYNTNMGQFKIDETLKTSGTIVSHREGTKNAKIEVSVLRRM